MLIIDPPSLLVFEGVVVKFTRKCSVCGLRGHDRRLCPKLPRSEDAISACNTAAALAASIAASSQAIPKAPNEGIDIMRGGGRERRGGMVCVWGGGGIFFAELAI
jgi:hypothetical protein